MVPMASTLKHGRVNTFRGSYFVRNLEASETERFLERSCFWKNRCLGMF